MITHGGQYGLRQAARLARNIVRAAIVVFPTVAVSQAVADDVKDHRFESDLPGVHVCERRKGVVVCFARTPCKVTAEYFGDSQSREYYFKKFGYEPAKLVVTRSDGTIPISLKKKQLFEEADASLTDATRRVRERIADALSSAIDRGNASVDDSGFDLAGKIKLLSGPDGHYVAIGILLDDTFRKTDLRRVEEIRDHEQRSGAIVTAALAGGGGKLLVWLRRELAGISDVTGIVLNILYRKRGSEMAERSDRFLAHRSSSWSVGNTKFTQHTWFTQEIPVMTVEDVKDTYNVVVRVALGDIPDSEAQCCDSLHTLADIRLNENPRRSLEAYRRRP